MKSINHLYIALLRLLCMSLIVLSLGSTLMADVGSASAGSPYISRLSPRLVHGLADQYMRAHQGVTIDDMLRLPNSASQATVNSTVQTSDITLPSETSGTNAIATGSNGAPTSQTPDNINPVWSTITEQYIIFSSNRTSATNPTPSNNYHLFEMSPSGLPSSIVQLTTGTGNEFYPSILPGDGQIAFCESATPNPNSDTMSLYVIDTPTSTSPFNPTATGAPSPTLPSLQNPYYVRHPSYNGDLVAFAGTPEGNPGTFHIFTYNFGTGAVTQLTGDSGSFGTDDENPAFSPDGNYVAFDSTATGFNSSNQSTGINGTSIEAQNARNIFLVGFLGTPSPLKLTTASGTSSMQPAWTQNLSNPFLNPLGNRFFIFFSRWNGTHYDIYYLKAEYYNNTQGQFVPEVEGTNEGASGTTNTAVEVNTSETGSTTKYDNTQPAVSELLNYVTVTYVSQRYLINGINDNPTGTADANDVEPLNVPTAGTGTEHEILQSQLLDVTPPQILYYDTSSSEAVRVEATNTEVNGVPGSGTSTRQVTPGQQITFVVRVSDRQSGLGPNMYIQIKDPNSKYQQGSGLEHKVFTRSNGSPLSNYLSILPYSPFLPGTQNEAATLWTEPAVAGWDGAQPIYLGNVYPVSNGASTTIGGTSTIMAGATSFTIGNVTNGTNFNYGGLFNPNYGQIIQVGTGSDAEYQSLRAVTVSSGTTTFDVTPLQNNHAAGETVKVVQQFDPLGQEVDCQAINANATDGSNGAPNAANTSDFSIPEYAAGVDDATPFSGNDSGPATVWLKLHISPDQDGEGGVLYYATWTTPTLPSDWYLDVISYDRAQYPIPYDVGTDYSTVDSINWRIYDNVWGFTTDNFTKQSGVLLVDDYGLPQKFDSSRFEFNAANNTLPGTFYGAESYITDFDVNWNDVLGGTTETALPQYGFTPNQTFPAASGTPPPALLAPLYHDSDMPSDGSTLIHNEYPWNQATVYGSSFPGHPNSNVDNYDPGYANALGVNSYSDYQQQGGIGTIPQRDSAPTPSSQSYDIWRILARGPIPTSFLQSYEPITEVQPPSNKQVLVASGCVIWVSPFTGDEFSGPGTLADPGTQSELEAYLNAGGRLDVEGIDIGYTLTGDGSISNPFYTTYLNADFGEDDAGFTPSTVGLKSLYSTASDGYTVGHITHDAYLNATNAATANMGTYQHSNFIYPTTGAPYWTYSPPSNGPIDLADSEPFPGGNYAPIRSDASLDDLGYTGSQNGFIDAIKPASSNVNVELAASNYAAGTPTDELIWSVGTNGSIVAYSSFGLESISQEAAEFTPPTPGGSSIGTDPYFVTKNQRSDIIHNLICLLRTGSIQGQITSTASAGQGVGGATVIATLNNDPTFSYSGVTDANGNYKIDGLPPGLYGVGASASGYYQHPTGSANEALHGGDYTTLNIALQPQTPGTLQVTVEDSSSKAPIPNVTVTATSTTGGSNFTAVSNTSGIATFSNIASGSYNLTYLSSTYSSTPVSQTPANPVTIVTSQTTTVLTLLQQAPGIIYGNVTDSSSNPITQGTVTVKNSSGTMVGTASIGTLPANPVSPTESYQVAVPLNEGPYTVTAVAVGYQAATASVPTVTAGSPVRQDFVLQTANPGSIYGIVGVGANPASSPVGGITVTMTDANGKVYTYTTSSTLTTAPDSGQENYTSATLPAGPYTVAVDVANPPPAQAVIIPSGGSVRADFSIQTTYPSGLTLFSSPYDFSRSGLSLSTILGYSNPTLAVWDPAISEYDVTGVTPPGGRTNLANQIVLGQGYWARFPSPGVFLDSAGGTPAPTNTPFTITLQKGWNMIGDPFTGSVNIADFKVVNIKGTTYTWQQATSTAISLVDPILYSYSGSQYVEHYVGSTIGQGSDLNPTLAPYVGYWIQAFTPVALVIAPSPAVPTGLTATAGSASVALSWTAVPGATGYNIYRGTSSGAETLLKSGVTTNSYTDGSASSGTTYYYEVTATSAAGESGMSNEASATPS